MKQDILHKKEYSLLFLTAAWIFLLLVCRRAGAEGACYLGISLLLVAMLYTLFGSLISEEFGRLVRKRVEKKETAGIWQYEKRMLLFQTGLGIVGFISLFLLSTVFANSLHIPELEAMLRLASFLIPLRGIRSCLGELSFAMEKKKLALFGKALECGTLFGVGTWIVMKYDSYGKSVSNLLRQDRFYSYYIIMGFILAAIVAEAVTVMYLFVVVIFCAKRLEFRSQLGPKKRNVIGLVSVYNRICWKLFTYVAATGILYYLLYETIKNFENVESAIQQIGTWLGSIGIFGAIFTTIALYFSYEYLFRMNFGVAREENRNSRVFFMYYLQYSFSFAVMPLMLCIILSEQIAGFMGLSKELVKEYMSLGMMLTIPILFLIAVFSAWQQIRPMFYFLTFVAFGFFACFVYQKWFLETEAVMGLVKTLLIFMSLFALLHLVLLFREIGYSTDILFRLLIPIIDALLIGLIMMLLRNLTYPHLGDGFTILVCLMSGLVLYWAVLFVLHLVRDQDLKYMPVFRFFHNEKRRMSE